MRRISSPLFAIVVGVLAAAIAFVAEPGWLRPVLLTALASALVLIPFMPRHWSRFARLGVRALFAGLALLGVAVSAGHMPAFLAWDAMERGDFAEASRFLMEVRSRAEQRGVPLGGVKVTRSGVVFADRVDILVSQAVVAYRRGDSEAARVYLSEATTAAETATDQACIKSVAWLEDRLE